jgi:hypothetical protein
MLRSQQGFIVPRIDLDFKLISKCMLIRSQFSDLEIDGKKLAIEKKLEKTEEGCIPV